MISDEKFYSASDKNHFLGAMLAIFAPIAIGGAPWGYIGFLLIIVFAAIKEFWYDVYFEDADERGSGLRDFLGYLIGAVTGLGLFLLSQELG